MKIILAGATGFIGKQLIHSLVSEGHTLKVLTRDPEKARRGLDPSVEALAWDAKTIDAWAEAMDGADAVINLTGESIAAKRWNTKVKRSLVESRVSSTRALAEAVRQAAEKPKVFINASAVGFYGDVPDGEVDESRSSSNDFLGRLCQAWENEVVKVSALGVREVRLRIGIVLGGGGGALEKMVTPFKLFAGGPLGSGKQWFPWIHRDDVVGIMLFALKNASVQGPVNLTSPNPVTMKDFCKALGRTLHRPSWAPVPGFILKIVVGEFAASLLAGQKAIPKKILTAGYRFKIDQVDHALQDILLKK